ncbi:MAG: ABC transporter permease [Actinomycetota bacterium]
MSAVLRLVRRDLVRSVRRQGVVVLLVAVAVGLGVFTAVSERSTRLTDQDSFRQQYGSSEIGIANPGRGADVDRLVAEIESAGGEVILRRQLTVDRPLPATYVDTDLGSPLAADYFVGIVGHPPQAEGEIAIDAQWADDAGLTVGSRLPTVLGSEAEVVGIVTLPSRHSNRLGFVVPGSLAGRGRSIAEPTPDVAIVDGPVVGAQIGVSGLPEDEVTDLVLATLGEPGADVDGRPSPRWHVEASPDSSTSYAYSPFYDDGRPARNGSVVTAVLLIEVGLLSAVAFAISARRRVVDLGRLSAIGASPRDLTRLLVAEAVIVSAVGALVGVGVALVLASAWPEGALTYASFFAGGSQLPTDIQVHIDDVAGPVVAALVMGLVASWVPARRAAALDPDAALSAAPDRRRPAAAAVRAAVAGLIAALVVLTAAGYADGAAGAGRQWWSGSAGHLAFGGMLLLLASVAVLVSALVHRLGRVGFDGVSGVLRLAMRDAERHRVRTVAAALSVALLLGAGLFISTALRFDNAQRGPDRTVAGARIVALDPPFGDPSWFDPAAPTADRPDPSTLADVTVIEVDAVGAGYGGGLWGWLNPDPDTSSTEVGTVFNAWVVDDRLAELLDLGPDALGALARPGTVLVSRDVAPEGAARIGVLDIVGRGPETAMVDPWPVEVVHHDGVGPVTLVGAETAASWGLEPQTVAAVTAAEGFTDADVAALDLLGIVVAADSAEEGGSGWRSDVVILAIVGTVVLAIYRVVVGLVGVEIGATISTMLAVGGRPGLRARLLAATGFIHLSLAVAIAVPLGLLITVLALAAGEYPDVGILRALARTVPDIRLPWLYLVGAATLPVAAATVVAATTGVARPAVSRRAA